MTKPDHTWVFSFPVKGPKNGIYRKDMTAVEQLELWKIYQENWCEHKPSITVSVKENEWMGVGAWVYNNFEYMYDVNDTFYDNLGRWVYENNQYEDTTLPWGYTFPGDDTWRAFFGAIAQVGNHFYASQIPYEVGGHGAEDVWIRVNTGPTEWVNNGGITAYNGLHDFIKTMQLPPIDMNWAWIYSSWAGGGTTSPMTPQSFGIYCNYGATSFGKEPFIVYRGDSWTYDFLGALGDFNLDNHLNISDVVATCNFILGTGQAPPDGANVDMDGDGTIYADDLIAMVNLILGLNQ